MKIAIIFTALAEVSSILVFRNLIEELTKIEGNEIDLYYFDVKATFIISCYSQKISFFQSLPNYEYDIVHTTGIRPDLYIFLNKKKFPTNTKFISTIHSFIGVDLSNKYNPFISFLATKIWLHILKYHDVIVVLTKSAREHYSLRIKNVIKVINNGRTPTIFPEFINSDVDILQEKKNNYKIIATHAVISPIKGLDVVIKALQNLPNYIFIIFGNGIDISRLKKLAIACHVSERCLFMGHRKSIEYYFRYYDLYVMPSLSEGFPLALLEAVSNKTPCLTSDIETFKEIFTENEVPKFKVGNVLDFQKKVLNFEDKDYREKIIFNAYERYAECYTNEIMGSNYMKLYSEIIK
jgi:glycosyltransferase involved in cell wall biosynthesis